MGAGGQDQRAAAAREGGVALLEVVVASVVLMVILVPIAALLRTGVGQVGTAQSRTQAETLAVETANQIVTATLHTGTFPPAGIGGSWAAVSATPSIVDSKPFYLFEAGGWCVAGSTSSNLYANGTVTSSNQPTYFVVVKAQWGALASQATGALHAVVTDEAVATTALEQATYAKVGNVFTSCPIGLT